MILALKTDQIEAELYLFHDGKQMDEYRWQAHRELSNTLFEKIEDILKKNNVTKNDLDGLVVFKGPGSFTGLRISISVANALSYALKIPVIGAVSPNWLSIGVKSINDAKYETNHIIYPEYGTEAHITKPRK